MRPDRINPPLSRLTDSHLIASLIDGASAPDMRTLRWIDDLLAHYNGLNGLMSADPADFEALPLDPREFDQLLALIELTRRLLTPTHTEPPIIRSAEDAAHLLTDMRTLMQEHIRLLLLDSTYRVMSIPTLYIGTLKSAGLRVAEIFREPILHNSAAIILAHNHPGGSPQPSPEDVELTRALTAAGQLLDIVVFDHIIVGRDGWVSLKDMNLM